MHIQIAARHCMVPEPVLERTRTRLSGLVRYDPRLAAADVIFQEERHRKLAEVILSVDRQERIVAQGEGTDFQAALDRTVDRLSRKLRRLRKQSVDHQGAPREIVEEQVPPEVDPD